MAIGRAGFGHGVCPASSSWCYPLTTVFLELASCREPQPHGQHGGFSEVLLVRHWARQGLTQAGMWDKWLLVGWTPTLCEPGNGGKKLWA